MLNYEALTPAVDRAARIVKSSFPAHHDISDVKQELWVWIMENKNTVTRICVDSRGTDTALVQLLVKAANSYLKTEDAAVYGYDAEDQYFYSVDLIKSILEVIFRHEDWQSFASALDAMPKAKSDPSHSGDNLASYADVKSAVEKLPEDQYNAIVWRFKYSYTQQQIGIELGMSKEGARQLLDRAYSSIQRALGRRDLGDFRRGYNGRTADAVTRGSVGRSETAQHVVQRDYDGY